MAVGRERLLRRRLLRVVVEVESREDTEGCMLLREPPCTVYSDGERLPSEAVSAERANGSRFIA